MSSNRKSFSHDRGTGKGGYGRRDSGDGREAWKKGIKCLNFNAMTGVRMRDCQPGCGFAHPTDPEWNTATASARKSGSMGPPKDIPRHARDPPRDSGWNRGVSSRPSAPRTDRPGNKDPPTSSVWATTIDTIPFDLSNLPDTGTESASSGWGAGWGDGGSAARGGWGLPDPSAATPAASSALSGWGISGPAAPTTNSVSAANDAHVWDVISDTGGWGPPKSSTSAGVRSPVREVALAEMSTPATAPEGSRADKGWAGMTEKRGVNEPGSLPLPVSRPTSNKTENPSNPPPPSTLYTGFSFGKSHSRRSLTDNVDTTGKGNGTSVVELKSPLDKSDKPAEEWPKETTTAVSLPSPTLPNVPPPRSNSSTPKPSLRIVLPTQPPEHQSSALSLLLRSPFIQLTHSSPTRGEATMKSPQQIAWSGHIEILSRAVTAQMERMQLNNVASDRQRLISRITRRSGRPTVPGIPENVHENKTQDADAKLQAATAALAQTNAEADQRWWPTPRAGVDYEQVLSSLENDIEILQQLLGVPDTKDDEMEIDIPDSAEFESLHKKRSSVFREVQNMLPYIAERLRTTESFVKNQNEGLNGQISRILDKSHPPNTAPGASGLAKLEGIRERFEKLEGRMNTYLPDLQRRRTLAIQRATDLKALKSWYEELRRKEQELAFRKKKFTKEARELLADMAGGPTMEERVLQLSTSPVAQERMMRVMVPKLLEIANTYRSEDLEYAVQCQVTAKAEVEAWRLAREEKRKLRGEGFLKGLENELAIKAVERAGKEIDRRWNEVISVQKVPNKPPAIRIPGTG